MNEQSVVNCLTAYKQARRTDAEKQASLDLVNAVFASSEPISRDVFGLFGHKCGSLQAA